MKTLEKRNRRGALALLACGVFAAWAVTVVSCGPPAPVLQGKVVVIEGRTVSMLDETQPEAPPVVIDIATAEIGNAPVVGDVIRVVYRREGDVNRALAVMNLTRQDLSEGKAR